MAKSGGPFRLAVAFLLWAVGLAVALSLTFIGMCLLSAGLGWKTGPGPDLELQFGLCALGLPLVLSVLLFSARWGWLWAAWWFAFGLGVLGDAWVTAGRHGGGLGRTLLAPSSIWGSALLVAVIVVGWCVLQSWVAAQAMRSRGWAGLTITVSRQRLGLLLGGSTLVLAAGLLMAWGAPTAFDSGRWQACAPGFRGLSQPAWGDNTRAQMVADLMARQLRPGITEAEVLGLLGESDHPAGVYALFPRPTLAQTLLALAHWRGLCPGLEITYSAPPSLPRRVVGVRIMPDYIGYMD